MMCIYPHVVPIFTAMCPARRILDTRVMSAPQEAHEYRPSSKTRRTAFVTLRQRPLVQPGTRCRFKRGWGGVRCRHQQLWKSTQSGWCFGTFFIFPYIGSNNSSWLIFFSEGLKPPTSINQLCVFNDVCLEWLVSSHVSMDLPDGKQMASRMETQTHNHKIQCN